MSLRSFTIAPREAGITIQAFLAARLNLSRNRAKALLDQRGTFVNGRRVWMAHHVLAAGARVEVAAERAAAPPAPRVLYEDQELVVIAKPAGLVAAGSSSAETALKSAGQPLALRAAHRLDRDTSGCLLLAKTPAVFDALVAAFRDGRVLKLYHALAAGCVTPAAGTIRTPVDGLPAVSHYRVLDACAAASHLLVRIETGRTHQIRKHLAGIHHPVLGDTSYGGGRAVAANLRAVPRQMLHAAAIEFDHPVAHRRLRVEAPLPDDFRRWLRQLKLT